MQTQQTITLFGTVSNSATSRISKNGRKYTAFGVAIISDRNQQAFHYNVVAFGKQDHFAKPLQTGTRIKLVVQAQSQPDNIATLPLLTATFVHPIRQSRIRRYAKEMRLMTVPLAFTRYTGSTTPVRRHLLRVLEGCVFIWRTETRCLSRCSLPEARRSIGRGAESQSGWPRFCPKICRRLSVLTTAFRSPPLLR